jgi:SNF2 family DNA or RNA helicase
MVYNLITEGSIDEKIFKKIEDTRNTFNGFVEVDKAQSELLKQLNN